MRKNKLVLLFLLAVSLAFGFQSCDKDKEDSPATSTENTTGNGGQNNQNGGDNNGNSGDNNGNKTDPVPPTFDISENLNSESNTIESGEELKLTIGNLTAESLVSAFLDGEEIKVQNGVIVLPTTTVGEHKVKVVVDNEEKEFSFKVLLHKQPIESEEITVNGVTFKMNKVYGGKFNMGAQKTDPESSNYDSDASGDESPVHEVTLSSYSIGQTEVTQALWKAVMGVLPSEIASSEYAIQGDDKPVVYVSWDDIQTFLTTLNGMTGKTFRLPTEAEWEFAARGGINSKGYKYSGTTEEFGDYAWYWDNCAVDGQRGTHAVGTKKANELGLYDMSGNVLEWCQDWYGKYSDRPQADPEGASTGSPRVNRGGSWSMDAEVCRVSLRYSNAPDRRFYNRGFRLAL